MKTSQLRARYWRVVFFFGRVTLGFIFWDIVLYRIGLGGWAAHDRRLVRSVHTGCRAWRARTGCDRYMVPLSAPEGVTQAAAR